MLKDRGKPTAFSEDKRISVLFPIKLLRSISNVHMCMEVADDPFEGFRQLGKKS